MAQARFFSSTAQPTTLTANISNSSPTIPVAATTGFPVSFPYTVAVDYGSSLEELCDVTSASALNLNVNRAVDGTSAAGHSVGAVVRHVSSARDFNLLYAHVGASSGVHGIVGNVVGDTDIQTLTNKTLTSPAINGATFSGTLSGGVTVTSPSASTVPLIAQGAASQTADLFDVETSTPVQVLRVLPSGALIAASQSIATVPATFQAVTGQTADLTDWQVNAATVASVSAGGLFVGAGANLTQTATGTAPLSVQGLLGTTANLLNVINNATSNTNVFNIATSGTTTITQASTSTNTAALFTTGHGGLGNVIQVWGNDTTSNVAQMDLSGNLTANSFVTPKSAVGYSRRIYKASDTSRASTTTLTSDPDFLWGTGAGSGELINGATYQITGFLLYGGGNLGSSDFKVQMTTTAGSITPANFSMAAPSLSGINTLQAVATPFGSPEPYGTPGGVALLGAPFNAVFTVTSTGATLALQWAQNTSSATATVLKANSWLTITRMA